MNVQQEMRAAHAHHAGCAPDHVASAPATVLVAGDGVDSYGGASIIGLAQQRACAAVSRRSDDVISLQFTRADGQVLAATSTLAALNAPTGGSEEAQLAHRITGLIHTLIHRQVLSRETTGMDISVVSHVPHGVGLGEIAAAEAAITLACAGAHDDIDAPPLRTKLADVCAQSATAYATSSPLKARYTAALRGHGTTLNLVEQADGSVTQVTHPERLGLRMFVVAKEQAPQPDAYAESMRRRQEFIETAAANFGVASLRQLPDATARVVQWVEARHTVGDSSAPDPQRAREVLQRCEDETARALGAAQALRSQQIDALVRALHPHSGDAADEALATPALLGQLACECGAGVARPAAPGVSQSVLALVPASKAENFTSRMEEHLLVIPVTTGEVGRIEV